MKGGTYMSKHSASLIARKLGLKSHGNIAYGLSGNIFVSIYNEAFTGAVIANGGALSSAQINQLLDYLEDNKKRLCVKESSYEKPYITVHLDSHYGALTARRMAASASEITSYINAMGVRSACAICGAEGSTAAATANGINYLCEDCMVKLMQQSGNALEVKAHTGSYLRGFLGAAVGGLLGIIPWVLLGLIGILAAISGFITAWLCTKMYMVFKGKQGRLMILIIIFMLIVFTAAGVFSSWFVRALIHGNSNINSIMLYMFDDMTITGIFGDMIIGVFLAGIGAFAVIRGVVRTASGTGLKVTRLPF